jgi:hypothetical protein
MLKCRLTQLASCSLLPCMNNEVALRGSCDMLAHVQDRAIRAVPPSMRDSTDASYVRELTVGTEATTVTQGTEPARKASHSTRGARFFQTFSMPRELFMQSTPPMHSANDASISSYSGTPKANEGAMPQHQPPSQQNGCGLCHCQFH